MASSDRQLHSQSPLETTSMLPSPNYKSSSSPLPIRHTNSSNKSSSFLTDTLVFIGGSTFAFILIWTFWSFLNPSHTIITTTTSSSSPPFPQTNQQTFYDDPNLSYSIENSVKNWDSKRQQWLSLHPSFSVKSQERILMITGSQPSACKSPIGDHLLLRFFKNKVDYCRIHGHDIFYNNALFHPKMTTFWAKLPVVRAAMIAHPEAEWIWWVDSDAAFTDMHFKLPLDRYRDRNLIVHGWPHLVYDTKSWVSLNAGIFLIRNCQWSMDFMDVWASMGPQTPEFEKWGKIQRATLPDKLYPDADDQSGLVYLLLKQKEKWGNKIYLESEFYFEGYWEDIVGTLDNISSSYNNMEKKERTLRKPHAEKTSEDYDALWERHFEKDAGFSKKRPFITHFTGCQPCSGNHNEMYSAESCWNGMQKVLNFADDQVLRNYGLMRNGLLDSSSITPLPTD
ncbi:hypothetical protein ACHQM5_024849 [Ranunculus cassubicifolius]